MENLGFSYSERINVILHVTPHNTVEIHLQKLHKAARLHALYFVEVEQIIHRISRKFEFLHGFLHGIVTLVRLLFGGFRKVKVKFGVKYLPMLFLGWDIVAIHL